MPCLACDVDSVLSFEQNWNKKLVVAAFRLWRENGKMSAQDIGPLVQHRFDRLVKRNKRLTVSLYLNELLIKNVNSEVDRSAFSHNGFPPVGPWHLVGATMDNTLD